MYLTNEKKREGALKRIAKHLCRREKQCTSIPRGGGEGPSEKKTGKSKISYRRIKPDDKKREFPSPLPRKKTCINDIKTSISLILNDARGGKKKRMAV